MKIIFILMISLLFLSLINLVNAVAVSGIYSEDKHLEMYPGESKVIVFTLQNMAGDSDVKFEVNITQGSEIAELVNENNEYLVPLHSNNVLVEIRVSIPKEAVVGKVYNVKIGFSPVSISSNKGGMVQIVIGLSRYFNVNVVREQADLKELKEVKETGLLFVFGFFLLIFVISIILVIWFVVRNKKD